MAINIDLNALQKLINIEEERNLAMQELSEQLGIDISFSKEEVLKNAMDAYSNYISQEINNEVETWMKSLFLKT
tara:strand:- start:235 stop:456 length:222 start_codon:yes stop_codon:yes gene_type:complete